MYKEWFTAGEVEVEADCRFAERWSGSVMGDSCENCEMVSGF